MTDKQITKAGIIVIGSFLIVFTIALCIVPVNAQVAYSNCDIYGNCQPVAGTTIYINGTPGAAGADGQNGTFSGILNTTQFINDSTTYSLGETWLRGIITGYGYLTNWLVPSTTNGYLSNDSTYIYFNETKLNNTIDDKLATVYYYPQSFSTAEGTESGGNNLGNLSFYDSQTFNITEGNGAESILFYVNFTNVTSFDTLRIREYYLGSTSHYINIEIFDSILNTWENYLSISGQAGQNVLAIPVADTSDHIIQGNVSIRFDHVENGISSHVLYIDYVQLTKGFSGVSIDHDGLAGRNSLTNHPWAMDIAGTRNITADLKVTGDIYGTTFIGSGNALTKLLLSQIIGSTFPSTNFRLTGSFPTLTINSTSGYPGINFYNNRSTTAIWSQINFYDNQSIKYWFMGTDSTNRFSISLFNGTNSFPTGMAFNKASLSSGQDVVFTTIGSNAVASSTLEVYGNTTIKGWVNSTSGGFVGDGSLITSLSATQLTTGSMPNARITNMTCATGFAAQNITSSGSQCIREGTNASSLTIGSMPNARITNMTCATGFAAQNTTSSGSQCIKVASTMGANVARTNDTTYTEGVDGFVFGNIHANLTAGVQCFWVLSCRVDGSATPTTIVQITSATYNSATGVGNSDVPFAFPVNSSNKWKCVTTSYGCKNDLYMNWVAL